MHERIATQLNEILEGTKGIPSCMTYGRTVLCQKDPVKGNSVESFRPITCLLLMWKLFTGIISEDIYCFMENENLLPEEKKGCRRKSRGTKDQLLIDKTILKACVCYFLSKFYFSQNDSPSKSMKNVFCII